MNKNTFYVILFSILIITVNFYIQMRFFPPSPQNKSVSTEEINENVNQSFVSLAPADTKNLQDIEKIITISTSTFSARLSNKNAVMKSLKRKRIVNEVEEFVELIPPTDRDEAFRVLLSNSFEKAGATPDVFKPNNLESIFFNTSQPDGNTVVFSKDFITKENQAFTLKKVFSFKEGEDVFELAVSITNKKNEVLRLGGTAYTLVFGPQLGPAKELSSSSSVNRLNQRSFVGLLNNKLKTINVKANRSSTDNKQYGWSGISGRYFSLLILTNTAQYTTTFSAASVENLLSGGHVIYNRASIQSSAITDVFRIYAGPNSNSKLTKYNSADTNSFQISNANFNKIKPKRLLSFIERLFLWILNFIYKIIPNYGVAIIALTLIVRSATIPILQKSKKNSERMKSFGPKIQEIKERFSDDTARQSQEIMALYKRENFSPFSSMLPMVIQIPVFLGMYRVIYESFELWRQPFFGWITDLSEPDKLVTFDFAIPIIGWTSLNIFPILMLGTQFLSGLIVTKQQSQGNAVSSGKGMMLFFSYGFPFIIFFILYNSPSGLILYWIVSNMFTVFSMMENKKTNAQIVTEAKNKAIKINKNEKRKKTFIEKLQAQVNKYSR